ncbi:hypothetical protein [Streptacidiphilus sp. P02-A3a]|uniref:hypothetical protein n=1 Tax=Streptacidiphilus sp. P02-A3a TaxID=2704468 RepID=UPI0015FDEEB9|nr:hypothetical protein [Streptacidiphilus sp. P02-A3a]QMU70756.1 hypothetical protein GXP74_23640 [Streptacidiphilus sp. P02-A3a]
MRINGAETTAGVAARGHILLIGGAGTTRRGQLTRPEASLALLASVPTAALLASELPADIVQLVDPAEPQALLGYLRTAAAVPGPLLLALVGVLTADRRQHELHLALGRTRPDNVRYTGLPWSWLATELGRRPAGSTTVLADLVADKDAWAVLGARGGAALTADVPLWGQVSPPDTDIETVATPYTRALVDLLRRSTGRSTLADLHLLAVSTARLPERALALSAAHAAAAVGAAVPVPPPRDAAPEPGTAELLAASAAACQAGDLEAARRLAREAEQQAARAGGSGSAPAVAAREARAHLARLGGDLAAAAELWRGAAEDRLVLQAPDAPEVRAAVDNAHACWAGITDRRAAADQGPALLALRRRVPGPEGRGLLAAERQLERVRRP